MPVTEPAVNLVARGIRVAGQQGSGKGREGCFCGVRHGTAAVGSYGGFSRREGRVREDSEDVEALMQLMC